MTRVEHNGILIYLIKQLEAGIRPHFVEAVRGGGMTPAQYTALTVLRLRPGITSSELARRSFMRAQSMAPTTSSLLEAKLVSRKPDPENARKALLYLTPAGERKIESVERAVGDAERLLLAGMTAEEQIQFAALLRNARDALRRTPGSSERGWPAHRQKGAPS